MLQPRRPTGGPLHLKTGRGCKTDETKTSQHFRPLRAPCWLAAAQLLHSLREDLTVFHFLPEVEEVLLGGWEEAGSGGGVDMPQ